MSELNENQKKMLGLQRLGIESTITADELTIHSDKPPDDKTILDAYAEYEAEQEALKNAPSLEEKFERLQTKLVEKNIITAAEKQTIATLKASR